MQSGIRLILERLLDYGEAFRGLVSVSADMGQKTGGSEDAASHQELTDLISFVRAGLKRELGHKYGRGTNTVVVYLLDREIEQMSSQQLPPEAGKGDRRPLGEREHEQIVAALREEIAHLPLSAQIPVILTTTEVRPALREVIAPELPRVSVISYEELPPDISVQPVARIGLAAVNFPW